MGFRSIKEDTLADMKNFNTLAGLNNSGKSNYLRALNLFFNGEVEPGEKLDFFKDYYKPDSCKKRKKKEIKIEVTFNLPNNFKFRKGLKEVERLLNPPSFTISKVWRRGETAPRIYLNNQPSPLQPDQHQKVELFLSLISFRYIPNRVLPIDVIKREHQALRDVLIRRVAKRKPRMGKNVFKSIADTSKQLISILLKELQDTIPDFGDIRLATPTSFADMVFALGYKLKEQGFEIEDSMQGSGIQSILMFNTLYLIDKDYFQKFGWKQAAIWAIEEPESSLHFSLEAKIGFFLSRIANEQNNRLQIISTTHSEVVVQYSDKCYLVKKEKNGSKSESGEVSDMLHKMTKTGVSGWQHPILKNPFEILILVDGDYDVTFWNKVFGLPRYKPKKRVNVCCLRDVTLSKKNETGGTKALIKYIKNNTKVIKNRNPQYPVIVILDWETKSEENEFKKHFNENDPIIILTWPEADANPRLGKEFTGVERFLSNRIIESIPSYKEIVFQNQSGGYTVPKNRYDQFKREVSEKIKNDLIEDDLSYAERFILDVIAALSNH